MEPTPIYNAYNVILYLVNKGVFQLFGENSRVLSRLAAKLYCGLPSFSKHS
ncbi:MAG: hypothetical protein PQ964_00065 [Methanobacteriaceae archaeon]|jgi:hypothetical protein